MRNQVSFQKLTKVYLSQKNTCKQEVEFEIQNLF